MDLLLASYGSSDDDDDRQWVHQPQTLLPDSTSLFSSLPLPKSKSSSSSSSSSLFSSLPRPKSSSADDVGPPSSSSPLFSTLPKPAASATAKTIVRITPPLPPPKFLDDDEDEEEKERKLPRDSRTTAQAPSVRSFLSSIPLPRHSSTLGAGSSSSGSVRRSILETETEAAALSPDVPNPPAVEVESGPDAYRGYQYGGVPSYGDGAAYQETYSVVIGEAGTVGWNGVDSGVPGDNVYCQDGVGSYGGISECPAIGDLRKRGRKEANVEIVEVKQDELMKNRPREDQMKLTGIAFGPSHQPTSTKGKPSKLHKRKHQIGSLYFDMKQKETELQERRARGLLTKSQTQGKYGW